jgi:hypothetical protein
VVVEAPILDGIDYLDVPARVVRRAIHWIGG